MGTIISFQTIGKVGESENVTRDAMNWPKEAKKIQDEKIAELKELMVNERNKILGMINYKHTHADYRKFLERVLQSVDSYIAGNNSDEDDIIYLLLYYLNYDYDDLDISLDDDKLNVKTYPDLITNKAMIFMLKHAKDWVNNGMIEELLWLILQH